jgi:hypothetical protein
VQLSRNRNNKQRSAEEGRLLLRGTHAMKSVKPSLNILEDFATGFNKDVSAPHSIHKWFTSHSRPRSCFVTFMLFSINFVAPNALVETFNRPENFSAPLPPHCHALAALKILRES